MAQLIHDIDENQILKIPDPIRENITQLKHLLPQ